MNGKERWGEDVLAVMGCCESYRLLVAAGISSGDGSDAGGGKQSFGLPKEKFQHPSGGLKNFGCQFKRLPSEIQRL